MKRKGGKKYFYWLGLMCRQYNTHSFHTTYVKLCEWQYPCYTAIEFNKGWWDKHLEIEDNQTSQNSPFSHSCQ